MDVESGELGIIDDFYVTPIVNGVMSVMRDLDTIPGDATPTDSPLSPTNTATNSQRSRHRPAASC